MPPTDRPQPHRQIVIRRATPADVPGVLPMVRAICALHEALDPARYAMLPDVVERYERWLPARAKDQKGVFLVAELAATGGQQELVGFLIATVEASIPIYQLASFAFIHDVFVATEHRARGIAGRLVDAACEAFSAKGITQIRLETAAQNEAARRLFASKGFRVATIDMLRELP